MTREYLFGNTIFAQKLRFLIKLDIRDGPTMSLAE